MFRFAVSSFATRRSSQNVLNPSGPSRIASLPYTSVFVIPGKRYYNKPSSRTCPSCGTTLPTPLPACSKCFNITPLSPNLTYFELLGVDTSSNLFKIDTQPLKVRFVDLQRLIHPDKWAQKGPQAQDLAAHISTVVNKAYKSLLDPLKRIEYILELQGIHIEESDSINDPVLIIEVMEMREALEEAQSREEVSEIQQENKSRIEELESAIADHVAKNDWGAVKQAAVKLKYLRGIDAAAEAWPNQAHDH